MNISIKVEKHSKGRFNVSLLNLDTRNHLGEFITTDGQLIDDISEYNNRGFEHCLCMFDSFTELKEYLITKLEDEI